MSEMEKTIENSKDDGDQNEQEAEEFDLKIRFIGPDSPYWQKLKTRFAVAYPSLNVEYTEYQDTENFNPMEQYLSLIEDQIDIIFFEPAFGDAKSVDFVKYIRRDLRTKRISTTVLHYHNATHEIITKYILAGSRINQIKSDEFSGVIIGAMALYDTSQAEIPAGHIAKIEKQIGLIQEMRLSYLNSEYYSVETNSPLLANSEIELIEHPLKDVLPSNHFRVNKITEDNLYYYKRFNVQLSSSLEDLNSCQKKIDSWLRNTQEKIKPKKTKILLIDPTLDWFRCLDKKIKELEYTVNFQTRVEGIDKILKRRNPHMIFICLDKGVTDSLAPLKRLVSYTKTLSKKPPYIIALNCSMNTDDLRASVGHEKIISFKGVLCSSELASMANKLETKLIQDEKNSLIDNPKQIKNIYFNSSSPKNMVTFERKVMLLGMTENLIFFRSKEPIPHFTVFKMLEPAEVLVTTVPPFSSEIGNFEKPYTIGILNCTGEVVNSKLRLHVNTLIREASEPVEEITTEDAGDIIQKDESKNPEQNKKD